MEEREPAGFAVVAHPGDTVLLCFDRDVTPEHFERISGSLKERLPEISFLLVSNVSGAVVYRPDDIPPAEGGGSNGSRIPVEAE